MAQAAIKAAAARRELLKTVMAAETESSASESFQGPLSTPKAPSKRVRAKTTPLPSAEKTPSTKTPAAKQGKMDEEAATPLKGKSLEFAGALPSYMCVFLHVCVCVAHLWSRHVRITSKAWGKPGIRFDACLGSPSTSTSCLILLGTCTCTQMSL